MKNVANICIALNVARDDDLGRGGCSLIMAFF